MHNFLHQPCRRRFNFTAYLNGDAHGYHKTTIEQHLCVCDDCFETLIEVLNRHLNQTARGLLLRRRRSRKTRCSCDKLFQISLEILPVILLSILNGARFAQT